MSDEKILQEILEQPGVIDRLIQTESEKIADIVKTIAGGFEYILIAARGTSDNVARYAQYTLGIRNRIAVALATPSIFTIYESPVKLTGALVMCISQSGQSPDLIAVLEEAKRQNRPTIAITNDIQSPISTRADFTIDLNAGPELATAATKTYSASLAAIALLSAHLQEDESAFKELATASTFMQKTIDQTGENLPGFHRFLDMNHCAVLGRGFNYSTAFEVSLKIKELSRVLADPYSTADFLHGPIATVQKGFPAVLVAPPGRMIEDTRTLAKKISQLGGEVISISADPEIISNSQITFPINAECPEWLSPLMTVIPGQYMALELARHRGLDPDRPEGLTKVTETW